MMSPGTIIAGLVASVVACGALVLCVVVAEREEAAICASKQGVLVRTIGYKVDYACVKVDALIATEGVKK